MSSTVGKTKRDGSDLEIVQKKKRRKGNLSLLEKELLSDVEEVVGSDDEEKEYDREEEDFQQAQSMPWPDLDDLQNIDPNVAPLKDEFVNDVLFISDRTEILIKL